MLKLKTKINNIANNKSKALVVLLIFIVILAIGNIKVKEYTNYMIQANNINKYKLDTLVTENRNIENKMEAKYEVKSTK